MRTRPTLRRQLITAFALVFAGALLVAVLGLAILLPRVDRPGWLVAYLLLLIAADVAVFAFFGHWLVRQRVLVPLERMIAAVEAIAAGETTRAIEPGESRELARLADAVRRMAEHLLAHQEELAANIQSLQETNRLLTEARDELVRAEKLASVGRLGAGIAHEIGNPLGAILGYLAVARRTADPRAAELLAQAEAEARRIDRIVRSLLDYARPRETRVRPIDVNETVRGSVDLLATQGRLGGIRVDLELAGGLPAVVADPYLLEQVLVNLLLNATDALNGRPDPAIRVRTARSIVRPRLPSPARRRDDPPDVDYSHRRRLHQPARIPRPDPFPVGGEVVEIRVADNGHGIPAHLVDQIFEPFVTTKEPGKGTGLGLAVAARLIDAMGGTIRVESREGEGATFTVLLPAAPRPAESALAAA